MNSKQQKRNDLYDPPINRNYSMQVGTRVYFSLWNDDQRIEGVIVKDDRDYYEVLADRPAIRTINNHYYEVVGSIFRVTKEKCVPVTITIEEDRVKQLLDCIRRASKAYNESASPLERMYLEGLVTAAEMLGLRQTSQ